MAEQIRNPVYRGYEQGSQAGHRLEAPGVPLVEARAKAQEGTLVGQPSGSPFSQEPSHAMAVSRGGPGYNPDITPAKLLRIYIGRAWGGAKRILGALWKKLREAVGPGVTLVYAEPPAEPVPA